MYDGNKPKGRRWNKHSFWRTKCSKIPYKTQKTIKRGRSRPGNISRNTR